MKNGDVILGNVYGKEDWTCGAWKIQRRKSDATTTDLFRFTARPMA
jgi:hypothetical protein